MKIEDENKKIIEDATNGFNNALNRVTKTAKIARIRSVLVELMHQYDIDFLVIENKEHLLDICAEVIVNEFRNNETQSLQSKSSKTTEILECGCIVSKGYRCPVHSCP